MNTYTQAERIVAGIFWDGVGDIDTFADTFCKAHLKDIRDLLNTEHVRIPADTPQEAYTKRSRKPKTLEAAEILGSIPESYTAPEWRGFAYTHHAYRDWHFVTHSMTLQMFTDLNKLASTETRTHGIQWLYVVDAQGHTKHLHGLVSFVFAHGLDTVRDMLHLPHDTLLEPIWGSFERAVGYLKKQALDTLELGTQPTRNILVDGNLVDLPRHDMLKAISAGEAVEDLEYPNKKDVDRALDKRCSNIRKLKHTSWTQNITRCKTRREAEKLAGELADTYTGKYFVINYNLLLPGGIFYKRPRTWFGEEVVLILNIPARFVNRQLKAPWISAIPEVVYTVKRTKNMF